MNNLIYYPLFEPSNEDWIKFALLYINTLNPIIPESGDRYLTEITARLSEDTDLIKIHRPNMEEGSRATIHALEEIEKILTNPQRYRGIFHTSNISSSWRQKRNFTHQLFEEKYTPDFKKFILDHKFGIESHRNVLIPKELAYIYMSILAQAISEESGVSVITDSEDLHIYSIFTRQTDRRSINRINLAHQIIELKLPDNIENISLDRVIQFRNRDGFKQRQSAFHEELNIYLSQLEDYANAEEFINNYKRALAEFTGDFIDLSTKIISIGLGTWMLSTHNATDYFNSIQHLLGIIAIAKPLISITNSWSTTQQSRFCKKYLASLTTI